MCSGYPAQPKRPWDSIRISYAEQRRNCARERESGQTIQEEETEDEEERKELKEGNT